MWAPCGSCSWSSAVVALASLILSHTPPPPFVVLAPCCCLLHTAPVIAIPHPSCCPQAVGFAAFLSSLLDRKAERGGQRWGSKTAFGPLSFKGHLGESPRMAVGRGWPSPEGLWHRSALWFAVLGAGTAFSLHPIGEAEGP